MSGADEGQQAGGDKWGDEISDERKAELELVLQAWKLEADHGEQRGPFDRLGSRSDVRLTGADVFWLAAVRTLAGTTQVEEGRDSMEELLRSLHDDGTRRRLGLLPLHLEGADLWQAHLEGAVLSGAHLEGAIFGPAHLEGASLSYAHLEGAYLHTGFLEGADLSLAHLESADLSSAHLEGAHLNSAHLEGAHLNSAHLEGADLSLAHLERASLWDVHLPGATLIAAHLEGAFLGNAHLEGRAYGPDNEADYQRVEPWVGKFSHVLAPADLRSAFLDSTTILTNATLGRAGRGPGQGYVQVADVRWGNVNLAVVKDWQPMMVLGDEREAWAWAPPKRETVGHSNDSAKKLNRKERAKVLRQQEQGWQAKVATAERERPELFRAAVRANRQLATALREQGMNEEADRFAYRAQVCQRRLFSLRRQWGRWFLQTLLAVLAGYGYRLGRIFGAYALVVGLFALAFLASGVVSSQAAPTVPRAFDALQISLNAIHGRVFFAQFHLDTVQSWLATAESIVGIVIEGVFVAMLVQRFFGGR